MLVDAGTYTCTATNKFDTVSASGGLVVRRKFHCIPITNYSQCQHKEVPLLLSRHILFCAGATKIQTAPLDVMVYEGTEAKFTCTATTDSEEVKNQQIEWMKDGEFIDYSLAQRMFKNEMDNSLTITGTISLDTAKYTCVASNGLDEDEASAQLIVQGKT